MSDQRVPPLAAEDHLCATCGLAYAEITRDDAVRTITGLTGELTSIINGLADDALHRRPDAGGWSITEYVYHLRDVYITYTIRLHRTRTEQDPVLEPMLNDLRAHRFGYTDRDPWNVIDELAATADGFCDEVALTSAADLQRTATRLPGEQRTAYWLIRQAMHEGVHHLADIRRVADEALG
jgi:hypothetical protein